MLGRGEVNHAEHLATDGFIADPENQGVPPLHGLDYVRQGEQQAADALGVHAGKCSAVQ